MISTSPPCKPRFGDVREDGYTYQQTDKRGYEQWLSPEGYKRNRIYYCFYSSKKRAAAGSIPFDISIEHLQSIFPQDGICPVLGTAMSFGGRTPINSPSIDRIIPLKGYTKGNVRWISHRANTLKNNASVAEMEAVLADLKNINEQETH